MQYKAGKFIMIVVFFASSLGAKAQVYGKEIYVTYDQDKYNTRVYALDKDCSKNDKDIEMKQLTIRGGKYQTLCFAPFEPSQCDMTTIYEVLVLQIIHKKRKRKLMTITVTGELDARFNYELNIDFEEGNHVINVPGLKNGLADLETSYVARGCKNITKLIQKIAP